MIFVTNDARMGRNIRHLRQMRNLSQEAFAAAVGMDSRTLAALERGTLLEIDAQILTEICCRFQVKIKKLVEDCI